MVSIRDEGERALAKVQAVAIDGKWFAAKHHLKILAAAQTVDLVVIRNRDAETMLCGHLDTCTRGCRRVHKVVGGFRV
jgi:hypothetical protein